MAKKEFSEKFHNFSDGKVSYIEWNNDSTLPGFQFSHATGFNSLTYKKLLEPLSNDFHIRAIDARGHGFTETEAIPEKMYNWAVYRDDLIRSVENFAEEKGQPIILGGHSMGGATIMQVAAKRPDLVCGLVLIEPVLIPRRNLRLIKIGRKFPIAKIIPFIKEATSRADSTLKRRRKFPNRDMIKKSYKGRGAFTTWNDGFLDDYIDGGTKEDEEFCVLTCHPEWEAATFSSWKHNAMEAIKNINCPITLLQGEIGSTTQEPGIKLLKKQDPNGVFRIIKESSHFLPMEYPEVIQEEIRKIKTRVY